MRKLGRRAIKTDSRTLRMGTYLTPSLPVPPRTIDWSNGEPKWGAMLNNELGCCTIAAAAHAVQVFSLNAGTEVTLPDSDVLKYYELWDGYQPGHPETDNGGIELDVLNRWKKEEFAGHALLAYASVNVRSTAQIRQAIWLFGGLYIGMLVPNYIMSDIPSLWDLPKSGSDGGIAGGHAVFVTGYDDVGLTFISWGSVYRMTWAFWARYVDEAYALLSPDFIQPRGVSSVGFDLAQLQADLALIH